MSSTKNVMKMERQPSLFAEKNAQNLTADPASSHTTPMAPQLFTIGYGGASVEGLIAALTAEHVVTLVDVRTMPRTRVPGFGKAALQISLPANQIAYRHVRELGAANWQDASPGARSDLLNDEPAGLRILAELVADHPVALMCAEKDHRACHRSYIAEQLTALVPDLRVQHLRPVSARSSVDGASASQRKVGGSSPSGRSFRRVER